MHTFIFVDIATYLSISGSLFTILTYLIFPESRTTTQIFALWLAMGSLGYSAPTFMRSTAYDNHVVCVMSGLILSYFSLTTLFTTACVAQCMRAIFQAAKEHIPPKISIEWWHWVFVWCVPLLLIPLPLTTKSYGMNREDEFCLIKTDFDKSRRDTIGDIWEAVILYIPVFVVIMFLAYAYRDISRCMKSWQVRDSHSCGGWAVCSKLDLMLELSRTGILYIARKNRNCCQASLLVSDNIDCSLHTSLLP